MRNRLALHIALILGSSVPLAAFAQAAAPAPHSTSAIAPMPLAKALENFSREAGLQIVYGSEIADSIRSPGAQAGLTPEQQLRQLLAGTGLTYRFVTPNTVTIVPGNVATNAGNPASAAVATAGSASANTASQEASSNNSKSAKDLASVVVTARSGVDVRTRAQTSYSITTIDEDRLRMQAPTSVTEAVKSVPGFWVESSGGEASGNIRARGIPVDGYGSVNLLEDGIPVQHDPALGYLNADQAFRLDETIERVEVVRGGPSSIFYSNAPAGAINFIPRQVDDMAEGLVKYTAGNYGLGRLDFWYGTPIGDGWKFSTGGFFRVDHNIRNPGFNSDNGGQLRATLSKQFENGDISFDVKRLDDRVGFDLGIPMYRNPSGDLVSVPGFNGNYGTVAGPETEHMQLQQGNGSYYNFDNSLGTDVKRTQFTVKFDYNLWGGWKLAEDLRYSSTNQIRNGVYPNAIETPDALYASAQGRLNQYYPGATGMQLQYVDSGAAFAPNQNGNGLVILGGLRGINMSVNELTSNTRLMRKFEFGDQTHDVTLGYYHAYFNQSFDRFSSTVLLDTSDNAKLLNLVAVNAAGQPVGLLTDGGIYNNGYEWAHAHGTSNTDAFYLSDEWQVTDKLRIDGGARWERVNTTGWTELSTTANLGTPWSSGILTGNGQYATYDHSFNKLGWTVGANYQFSDHQGVFARYTSTFRLPNLSSYITSPTATPITQTMTLPEVGYKFANRFIETYETFFYTKYNNVSFSNYVFNPNTGASTAQTGYANTETYGLELEGTIYPSKLFDLQYSATLQDPRYKGLRYTTIQAGAPLLLDYDDDQLIRVPRKSLRIVPGVNLLDNKLRLQMSWEYEGKRFSDTANSVVLPQYDTINFSARYQATPNLSFFLYADNLNNSLGLTEGNPRSGELKSSDAGATVFIARPLLGRSFRASVMYRF